MDQSEDPEELQSYSMTGGGVSAHEHLEIEGVVSDSDSAPARKVNRSWQLGRPWFMGASNSMTSKEDPSEENRYYGGIMKQDNDTKDTADRTLPQQHTLSPGQGLFPRKQRRMHVDEETASEFKESDWTPPDSSYGAACPVCGWIPKHVRQKIELSLIALSVLCFLWAVVVTSTRVSNAGKAMHNETSLGDDFYSQSSITDDLT